MKTSQAPTFEKRNYYTFKDAEYGYLYGAIAPYIIGILFLLIVMSASDPKAAVDTLWYQIISAILTPLAFLSVFFLYNKSKRISFTAAKVNFKLNLKTWLIILVIPFVCFFCLQYLVGAFNIGLTSLGYQFSEIKIPLDNVGWYFLYLGLFALLPAICEELIFRGIIFNGLRKKMSDISAVLLSSLLFMLMHASLEQMIFPFLLGIVLAWVVLRTGSVAASMVIHFMCNAINITFSFIYNMTGFNIGMQDHWLYYMLAAILLVVGVAIFFLIDRFFFKKKNAQNIEKEEKSKGLPIVMLVGILISVIVLVVNIVSAFK